jgi:phosphinothricin acetyltransferase
MIVRAAVESDWPRIREIYGQGIESGHATFETEPPSWEEWDRARHPACRLVADEDGSLIGFAALSPVSKRPVYAGVCEVMVYVAESARGRGVGGRLMETLVRDSEAAGIWTLHSGIFPENEASIRAHERVGFRVVGTLSRIGRFHDGRWRDTVLMERRSDVTGQD